MSTLSAGEASKKQCDLTQGNHICSTQLKFAKISQNLSSDAGLTQGNHTCSIQMKFVKISQNVSSAAIVIGA